MVLLVQRLSKFYCKLENHLHHSHIHEHEEALLQASFHDFQSTLSISLNQIPLKPKRGSEFFSFSWIQQCFELLPLINNAFAKLVADIDHPMSKWEAASVEEYLNYNLCLLELLNSMTSLLSHLGQARLAVSHALALLVEKDKENSLTLAIKRLGAIQFQEKSSGPIKKKEFFEDPEAKGHTFITTTKGRVIHQALVEVKSIGFWACGVILAGLWGDAKPFLRMRHVAQGFSNSCLSKLDSSICQVIKENGGGVLQEVKELNDSAASLAAVDGGTGKSRGSSEDLQRRLEVFEKLMDSLGKEVDHFFRKLLAGRSDLLDGVRFYKK